MEKPKITKTSTISMHLKVGVAYAEKILTIDPKLFDMITKPND
jgi:hypothetical protein